MEELALAFKSQLRALVARSGRTHQEIAEAIGSLVSASSISDWQNTKKGRTPSVPQLCALADYFCVTLDEIVGRGSQPPASLPANCWLVDLDYIDAARRGQEPPDPRDRPAVPIPPRAKVLTSKEWERLRTELEGANR